MIAKDARYSCISMTRPLGPNFFSNKSPITPPKKPLIPKPSHEDRIQDGGLRGGPPAHLHEVGDHEGEEHHRGDEAAT